MHNYSTIIKPKKLNTILLFKVIIKRLVYM